MAERNVAAILYGATLFFQVIGERLVALAARYRFPALYEWREFVTAAGLMSYSTDRNEVGRGAGRYAGRILKGEKPADCRSFSRRASSSSSTSRPRSRLA
jgi:putative tryptophan/tyrosine transport system substrate-binding protein